MTLALLDLNSLHNSHSSQPSIGVGTIQYNDCAGYQRSRERSACGRKIEGCLCADRFRRGNVDSYLPAAHIGDTVRDAPDTVAHTALMFHWTNSWETWILTTFSDLEENLTVYDLFEQALTEQGYTVRVICAGVFGIEYLHLVPIVQGARTHIDILKNAVYPIHPAGTFTKIQFAERFSIRRSNRNHIGSRR